MSLLSSVPFSFHMLYGAEVIFVQENSAFISMRRIKESLPYRRYSKLHRLVILSLVASVFVLSPIIVSELHKYCTLLGGLKRFSNFEHICGLEAFGPTGCLCMALCRLGYDLQIDVAYRNTMNILYTAQERTRIP